MKWYQRLLHRLSGTLSLQTRIFFAAFCILSTIAFYTYYTILAQQQLAAITHDILDTRIVTMHAAENVKHFIRDYDDNLFRYLATGDLEELRQRQSLENSSREAISQLSTLSHSVIIEKRLTVLSSESELYFMDVSRLLQFAQKNKLPEDAGVFTAAAWARNQGSQRQELNLLSEDGKTRLNHIFALCDELITLNRFELEKAQQEMALLLEDSGRTGIRLGLVVALVVLLLAVGLAVSLVGPLRALLQGVRRVGAGDLTVEIPVRYDDEVGELTRAFNRMARTVHIQQERLLKESITDGLTGLYNQRHFRTLLKQEVDRARRRNETLCLLMIDLDHFKQFNDTQGHESGNELLKLICDAMKENIRDSDAFARYGGDELALILPDTTIEEAHLLGEKLREIVATAPWTGADKTPKARVTLSVGGAGYPQDAKSMQDLILRADEALYEAKTAGRNCLRWTGAATHVA